MLPRGWLTAGQPLKESQLVAATNASATGAHGQFLYHTASGALYWHVDGTILDDPVQLANLTGAPWLTASDFNRV